ncbi:MAG TPA: ankyrin repeat domain-containing protein [Gemmataceae bacterium]|nr:ankyrin repeat domain-containing protein [Gemmataceae bacterium]
MKFSSNATVFFAASLVTCFVIGSGGEPPELEKLEAKSLFSDPQVLKLVQAAEQGDEKTIDELVKQGVDVNAKGRYGVTPLLRCLWAQNKKGYSKLLGHKADSNILNERGQSVMSQAALADNPFWLDQALKNGGNPNLVNKGSKFNPGETPLFYAIGNQRTENAKLLIAAGADIHHKNEKGYFPLMLAVSRPAYPIAYLLLEAGADYHQKEPFGGKNAVEWISGRNLDSIPPHMVDEQGPWYLKTVEWLRNKGEKIEIRAEKEKGK